MDELPGKDDSAQTDFLLGNGAQKVPRQGRKQAMRGLRSLKKLCRWPFLSDHGLAVALLDPFAGAASARGHSTRRPWRRSASSAPAAKARAQRTSGSRQPKAGAGSPGAAAGSGAKVAGSGRKGRHLAYM